MAKMKDCDTAAVGALSYPMVFPRPEEAWESSMTEGRIPKALFDFYCAASFFSIGAEPKSLRDPDRLLFSYLKAVVNGIREAFEDAAIALDGIRTAEANHCTPAKLRNREPFDNAAGQNSRRNMRYLLAELCGVLDQASEVVALLFVNMVPGLRLGRADFGKLMAAAGRPPAAAPLIVSPREGLLEELLAVVARETAGTGPEADWYQLFQLYRNKTAHVGGYMFPSIGLPSKTSDDWHTFLPNNWPVFSEQHVTVGAAPPASARDSQGLAIHFETNFIHQDIVEYSERLTARIRDVTGAIFEVLLRAYKTCSDFDPDPGAVPTLMSERQRWAFRYFPDPPSTP